MNIMASISCNVGAVAAAGAGGGGRLGSSPNLPLDDRPSWRDSARCSSGPGTSPAGGEGRASPGLLRPTALSSMQMALATEKAAGRGSPRGGGEGRIVAGAVRDELRGDDEKPLLMFRKDAAELAAAPSSSCRGSNAACCLKVGLDKGTPVAARGATAARRRRCGGKTPPQKQNRAVLNDHLLWLELRRELRSRGVVTNVAANVVARRYIHELTRGLEEGGGKCEGGEPSSGGGIDLVENARFFGLMVDGGAGALCSSLAKMFDGGNASTHFVGSAPCLSDLFNEDDGEERGKTRVNLKSAEDLLASHAAAAQREADRLRRQRQPGAVGRMMRNLGDSLSREAQLEPSSSAEPPSPRTEEDLLVRACSPSHPGSSGCLAAAAATATATTAAAALGGDSQPQPFRRQRRAGSFGALGSTMATHLTGLQEQEQEQVPLPLRARQGEMAPFYMYEALAEKKTSSHEKEEEGSRREVLGYPSVVKAFEVLREGEPDDVIVGVGGGGGEEEEEGLLVGFGEKPPGGRMRRRSSVIAKTA